MIMSLNNITCPIVLEEPEKLLQIQSSRMIGLHDIHIKYHNNLVTLEI